MTGHSWIGIGGVIFVGALVIAVSFLASPIFALIILAALAVFAAPVLFGARRVAGEHPEETNLNAVSGTDNPPDASPEAPHGYTPSV
jgi:hypothetical protein